MHINYGKINWGENNFSFDCYWFRKLELFLKRFYEPSSIIWTKFSDGLDYCRNFSCSNNNHKLDNEGLGLK